jgi:hypothetical protein
MRKEGFIFNKAGKKEEDFKVGEIELKDCQNIIIIVF